MSVKVGGKIVYDMPLGLSHSWTRNAQMLWNRLADPADEITNFGEGYFTVKSTSGYAGSVYRNECNWTGTVNNHTYGIVIGTGTDAESYEGYALATQIETGTGAGQMEYQAMANATNEWDSDEITTTHSRYFNNNSGGAITVNEVGVYATAGGMGTYMLCRDKLASGVEVPDTGQLYVTYAVTFELSP